MQLPVALYNHCAEYIMQIKRFLLAEINFFWTLQLVYCRCHYKSFLLHPNRNVFPPSLCLRGHNPAHAHLSLTPLSVSQSLHLHNPCDIARHMGLRLSYWMGKECCGISGGWRQPKKMTQPWHIHSIFPALKAWRKNRTKSACSRDVIEKKTTDYTESKQVRRHKHNACSTIDCID